MWRVISYFDLIKGYSSAFDDTIRRTFDRNDIQWGGNATSVITMENLLEMLKEQHFTSNTEKEYIRFKEDLKFKEEGKSSSGPWHHLVIVLEKI